MRISKLLVVLGVTLTMSACSLFHGKRQTIEQLARDLDLPVKNDISQKLDHQFQPRGRGTDPRQFFGQNYARIATICGAKAAQLGYEGRS